MSPTEVSPARRRPCSAGEPSVFKGSYPADQLSRSLRMRGDRARCASRDPTRLVGAAKSQRQVAPVVQSVSDAELHEGAVVLCAYQAVLAQPEQPVAALSPVPGAALGI